MKKRTLKAVYRAAISELDNNNIDNNTIVIKQSVGSGSNFNTIYSFIFGVDPGKCSWITQKNPDNLFNGELAVNFCSSYARADFKVENGKFLPYTKVSDLLNQIDIVGTPTDFQFAISMIADIYPMSLESTEIETLVALAQAQRTNQFLSWAKVHFDAMVSDELVKGNKIFYESLENSSDEILKKVQKAISERNKRIMKEIEDKKICQITQNKIESDKAENVLTALRAGRPSAISEEVARLASTIFEHSDVSLYFNRFIVKPESIIFSITNDPSGLFRIDIDEKSKLFRFRFEHSTTNEASSTGVEKSYSSEEELMDFVEKAISYYKGEGPLF